MLLATGAEAGRHGSDGRPPHKACPSSLSSDGDTAIVGGFGDDRSAGAAWVYTRSGGVWTQQGGKLVGTGATGRPQQGGSVSLCPSDGNTAIMGGPRNNNKRGRHGSSRAAAACGPSKVVKLVGTGASGNANKACFVSLSSDSNTAIVGGPGDNDLVQGRRGSTRAAVAPSGPSKEASWSARERDGSRRNEAALRLAVLRRQHGHRWRGGGGPT